LRNEILRNLDVLESVDSGVEKLLAVLKKEN